MDNGVGLFQAFELATLPIRNRKGADSAVAREALSPGETAGSTTLADSPGCNSPRPARHALQKPLSQIGRRCR